MKKLLFVLLSIIPSVSFADMATGPYDDPWNRGSNPSVDSYLLMVLDHPAIFLFVSATIVIVIMLIVRYYKNRKKNVDFPN